MIKRRQFNAGLLATFAAGAPSLANAARARSGGLFHVSVGRRLFAYRVDVLNGRLRPVAGPALAPEEIQFGWPHPTRDVLYVASSDQNTTRQDRHSLIALSIGSDGVPTPFGPPAALAARPIHLTVDHTGHYVLVAYNRPSNVSVHRLAKDGSIGDVIPQKAALETGVYPHQIRMMPTNAAVLVPARGNDRGSSSPEQPGSLRIFDFADGQLSNAQAVAPDGGLNFRPRHVDFSPSGRWAYVALESQNAVQSYRITGNRLAEEPSYTSKTLAADAPEQSGQRASAIRVHPGGSHLYVANRGTGTEDLPDGRSLSIGENTIAVFAIEQASGEPHLVQRIDIGGVHARTMDISADGGWLVAGTIRPALVKDGEAIATVEAGLTLFRICADGQLQLAHKLDIATDGDPVFWVGAWQ